MHAIEYIGPRPQKPVKKSWMAAWLMVVMVVIGVTVVAKNFADKALAGYEKVTELKVDETVAWLSKNKSLGNQLAIAALEKTREVSSNPYLDLTISIDCCTDVVISSYSELNIDLQHLVNEDMKRNFRIYPQLWELRNPDVNIDHLRVPNLQRFFSRQGSEIELNELPAPEDFKFGDVVAWRLADGQIHMGVVVPGPGDLSNEQWIVHDLGSGAKWENRLLEYQLMGHYRYGGPESS